MPDRRKITWPERGGMRPSTHESLVRLSGLVRMAEPLRVHFEARFVDRHLPPLTAIDQSEKLTKRTHAKKGG
jgi:hypothetical protein